MKAILFAGKYRLLLTVLILMNAAAATSYAAPQGLDATFGAAGKVRIGLGGGQDTVFAAVRQADGKFVVAGRNYSPNGSVYNHLSLARYNANGSLDTAFGEGGKVETPVLATIQSAGTEAPTVYALAILPDGKIVAAGSALGELVTVRYNPNGTLDTTFRNAGDSNNPAGIVVTHLLKPVLCKGLIAQSDGKTVVLGNSLSDNGFFLARYKTDGSLDETFNAGSGFNGIVPVNLPYASFSGDALRIQNGKFIVAGRVNTPGDVLLMRFNADGAIDNSFDGDGIVTTADPEDSRAYAIAFYAPTADNSYILLAGASGNKAAVWRYDASNGALDNTFGTGGGTIVSLDASKATGIGLQTSGGAANKIVIAGRAGNSILVARLSLAGALDTTFGTNGTVATDINHADALLSPGAAMFIQPADNKIVVAGTFSNANVSPDSDVSIARYNANGTLDATFDGDGLKRDDNANLVAIAKSLSIQPDGKIVLADSRFIARLNPNGTLNTTFNGTGKIKLDTKFAAAAAAIQADGKIVVAGNLKVPLPNLVSAAVLRFNQDGTPDTTFGVGGTAVVPLPSYALALALQPDGKIVAAGYYASNQYNEDFAVYRFNADGSPDPAFDGDGVATTSASVERDRANAVAITPDGKIVAAGYVDAFNSSDFAVVVYNADGSLDTTFNDDGVAFTTFELASRDTAKCVAIQSGKILVGGSTGNNSSPKKMALARYNADGLLDRTFGIGGKAVVADPTHELEINALATQPDGKILTAGTIYSDAPTYSDFSVTRFNNNGSLDTSYGVGGMLTVDVNSPGDEAYALAVDSSGKVIVGGTSDGMIGIVRLQYSRAAFDFDGDGKSDLSVFRPSDSNWFVNRSADGFLGLQFGVSSDKLAPADYDGDGKTDVAVYRGGTWIILQSSNNQVRYAPFGLSDDLPKPGDFDGDGKADIAVFRPSNGYWYYLQSSNNQVRSIQFGQANDVPMPGDYDGDSKTDIAVWRPSTGVWFILRSTDSSVQAAQFGQSGDIPINGDFNSDGKNDLTVYRPSSGTWFVARSTANSPAQNFDAVQFGVSTDTPVAADYDGDGKTDYAVYRGGIWIILQSSNSQVRYAQFGVASDKPVAAVYQP